MQLNNFSNLTNIRFANSIFLKVDTRNHRIERIIASHEWLMSKKCEYVKLSRLKCENQINPEKVTG